MALSEGDGCGEKNTESRILFTIYNCSQSPVDLAAGDVRRIALSKDRDGLYSRFIDGIRCPKSDTLITIEVVTDGDLNKELLGKPTCCQEDCTLRTFANPGYVRIPAKERQKR